MPNPFIEVTLFGGALSAEESNKIRAFLVKASLDHAPTYEKTFLCREIYGKCPEEYCSCQVPIHTMIFTNCFLSRKHARRVLRELRIDRKFQVSYRGFLIRVVAPVSKRYQLDVERISAYLGGKILGVDTLAVRSRALAKMSLPGIVRLLYRKFGVKVFCALYHPNTFKNTREHYIISMPNK